MPCHVRHVISIPHPTPLPFAELVFNIDCGTRDKSGQSLLYVNDDIDQQQLGVGSFWVGEFQPYSNSIK